MFSHFYTDIQNYPLFPSPLPHTVTEPVPEGPELANDDGDWVGPLGEWEHQVSQCVHSARGGQDHG